MLDRLAFLSALLAAGSPAAQTAPCLSFNDTNTTVSTSLAASPFFGRNPNSRAYQFTPSTALTGQAAVIFRGDGFFHFAAEANEAGAVFGLGRRSVGHLGDVFGFAVDVGDERHQVLLEARVVVWAAEPPLAAEL